MNKTLDIQEWLETRNEEVVIKVTRRDAELLRLAMSRMIAINLDDKEQSFDEKDFAHKWFTDIRSSIEDVIRVN